MAFWHPRAIYAVHPPQHFFSLIFADPPPYYCLNAVADLHSPPKETQHLVQEPQRPQFRVSDPKGSKGH